MKEKVYIIAVFRKGYTDFNMIEDITPDGTVTYTRDTSDAFVVTDNNYESLDKFISKVKEVDKEKEYKVKAIDLYV